MGLYTVVIYQTACKYFNKFCNHSCPESQCGLWPPSSGSLCSNTSFFGLWPPSSGWSQRRRRLLPVCGPEPHPREYRASLSIPPYPGWLQTACRSVSCGEECIKPHLPLYPHLLLSPLLLAKPNHPFKEAPETLLGCGPQPRPHTPGSARKLGSRAPFSLTSDL